jgi:hypothetical protein
MFCSGIIKKFQLRHSGHADGVPDPGRPRWRDYCSLFYIIVGIPLDF